jgi:hypothetical protein
MNVYLNLAIDETIFIKGIYADDEDSLRLLEDDEEIDSVAEINVEDYDFTWEYKEMSDTLIEFQLNFTNPDAISSSPYGFDRVLIEFDDITLLNDTRGIYILDRILLKDSPDLEASNFVENISPTVKAVTKTMIISTCIIAILMAVLAGGSLQNVWGLINTQGMTLYLICLNVTNLPDNAKDF